MAHDSPFDAEALTRRWDEMTSPLINHFQAYLQPHFNVLQASAEIIAFFAIYKFICTDPIDQIEAGIRKQCAPKLEGSLNVKIGRGIENICFYCPAS